MTNLLNPLANRYLSRFAKVYPGDHFDDVELNCDAFILSLKGDEILQFEDRESNFITVGGNGGFEHFPNGVIVPIGIAKLSAGTTCSVMALWHWKTD